MAFNIRAWRDWSASRALPHRLGSVPQLPPGAQAQTQDKPLLEQSVTETRDEPAMFKTRVNLVMVPGGRARRQQRPYYRLGQVRFPLFDKGKPQTITRFSMERSGAQRIKFMEDADGVGFVGGK